MTQPAKLTREQQRKLDREEDIYYSRLSDAFRRAKRLGRDIYKDILEIQLEDEYESKNKAKV
jgi:hypothetical protein